MRTIICAMIGYALFYFIRKNLAVALPSIEADLGISKVQLGKDRAAKQCQKWGIDEKNAFGGASGYKEVLKSGCDIVILATPPIFRARQDDVLDPNRPWGQRMVAIGDGELDFRKLRDRLDAINYNGWVSVESDFRSDADHALILRRFISGDPVWPK